jgi:2-polyprenyl-6-hydroxyphenyl methylase/3-demethylubiquinone-9 3-methyltransferase
MSFDLAELTHFAALSDQWWAQDGAFASLHALNPVRLRFMKEHICAHFQRDTSRIDAFSDLTFLDVGCGGGILCEPLARLGGRVTGIDPEARAIEVARAHAQAQGIAIEYQTTSLEALAQKEARFDVVCALEVVEHVLDLSAFLAALTRCLRPGGLLFLSTLNKTWKAYCAAIIGAEYVLHWLPRGTHSYEKFVSPETLTTHLSRYALLPCGSAGMTFSPVSRSWRLSEDTDVNYIMVWSKKDTESDSQKQGF